MADGNWWEADAYATAASARGSSDTSPGSAKPIDKSALLDAQDKADAAEKSLRLYGDVGGALRRFNPGPLKGTIYSALMPDDGGFWDSVGAAVGSVAGATRLMPQQDQDDYQRIKSAQAERIGIRSQEQKGVQAKNDEVQFKLADISPTKRLRVNDEIIGRAQREAEDQLLRSKVQSRWVSKYGSIANPMPNGRTFEQGLAIARREVSQGRKLPTPPPSARKNQGWNIQRAD